jgi:hypothetical protein
VRAHIEGGDRIPKPAVGFDVGRILGEESGRAIRCHFLEATGVELIETEDDRGSIGMSNQALHARVARVAKSSQSLLEAGCVLDVAEGYLGPTGHVPGRFRATHKHSVSSYEYVKLRGVRLPEASFMSLLGDAPAVLHMSVQRSVRCCLTGCDAPVEGGLVGRTGLLGQAGEQLVRWVATSVH